MVELGGKDVGEVVVALLLHAALALLLLRHVCVRRHLEVEVYGVLFDHVLRGAVSLQKRSLLVVDWAVLDAVVPPLGIVHHRLLGLLLGISVVP